MFFVKQIQPKLQTTVGIALSKDFRNDVIQMVATQPISEICEKYRISTV